MVDDEISAHFILETKTKGYDVIGVNVFHFTSMRFHFKKRDNSVPIPLLPCYLSTFGAGRKQCSFLPLHFASLTHKYLQDAK